MSKSKTLEDFRLSNGLLGKEIAQYRATIVDLQARASVSAECISLLGEISKSQAETIAKRDQRIDEQHNDILRFSTSNQYQFERITSLREVLRPIAAQSGEWSQWGCHASAALTNDSVVELEQDKAAKSKQSNVSTLDIRPNTKCEEKSYKVVYNASYSGFNLSATAQQWLNDHAGPEIYHDLMPRHHPALVECVETLGEAASSGRCGLKIYKLRGDRYRIDEDDGYEIVMEPADDVWIIVP